METGESVNENGPAPKSRPAGQKESACKPGSVENNHSSRPGVTAGLQQPTRKARGPRVAPCDASFPIWPCSEWGLPCRSVARLAVRSYRTISPLPVSGCPDHRRYLSVALSVASRRPGVTWHSALWSPDFPPPSFDGSGCSAYSTNDSTPVRPCRLRKVAARSRTPRSCAGH